MDELFGGGGGGDGGGASGAGGTNTNVTSTETSGPVRFGDVNVNPYFGGGDWTIVQGGNAVPGSVASTVTLAVAFIAGFLAWRVLKV